MKLRDIRVFDPACGCGNFLILAYRELRRLEQELLVELHKKETQRIIGIRDLCKVDVDQFYGIEINEWPCRIAEVGLWLSDHQANRLLAEAFGFPLQADPQATPTIRHGNALSIDWSAVLSPSDSVYLIGNPPFVGKKEQTAVQKAEVMSVWNRASGAGELDYVTCWYHKAADYIAGTKVRAAFVSTNSISQGEQVGILWGYLLGRGVRIHFAHTTFAWESEARGKAHVHVVIVGFGAYDVEGKTIYEYSSLKGPPNPIAAKNINPYLADAPDVVVRSRRTTINNAPRISYGSMMIDKPRKIEEGKDRYDRGLIIGGDDSRAVLLAENKKLDPYIKQCTGGDEYINSETKWCLWLVDAPPELIKSSASVKARVDGVRKFRLSSGRAQTQKLATTPTLFGERRQPSSRYLIIPKVSSETRRYIPIGFLEPDIIATGSALIVPDASAYDFGILSSSMHNAWMRYVGGRMKSDYQYSAEIVYNNFPWPDAPSAKQKVAVETAADAVLAARKKFPSSTLADLYDPLTMPPALSRAHAELDRAVESVTAPRASTRTASASSTFSQCTQRYQNRSQRQRQRAPRSANAGSPLAREQIPGEELAGATWWIGTVGPGSAAFLADRNDSFHSGWRGTVVASLREGAKIGTRGERRGHHRSPRERETRGRSVAVKRPRRSPAGDEAAPQPASRGGGGIRKGDCAAVEKAEGGRRGAGSRRLCGADPRAGLLARGIICAARRAPREREARRRGRGRPRTTGTAAKPWPAGA